MVRDGLFRQDLLFRLNVVRLHLPPLREREGDVGILLDHFLKIYSTRFGKNIKGFTPGVRQLLMNYSYPGNVRELRNIVEYATNICQADSIGIEHLPIYMNGEYEEGMAGMEHVHADPADGGHGKEISGRVTEMNWSEIEKKLIIETLLKVNGRKNKAADKLGWGRTTLWRKMKQYGLES
jgi:DNA-binding NtrC family response regulator